MSPTRVCLTAAFALAVLALPAAAQAQDEARRRAEQLNEEGKTLYKGKDFSGAVAKFRAAVSVSPEGRYYFNLCFVLHKMRLHRDALIACQAIRPGNATDRLVDKAAALIQEIRPKIDALSDSGSDDGGGSGDSTGDSADDGGGSDGGATDSGNGGGDNGGGDNGDNGGGDNGDNSGGGGGNSGGGSDNGDDSDQASSGTGGGGGGPSSGGPDAAGGTDAAVGAVAPPEDYRWSIGLDVGPVANLGLGAAPSEFGDSEDAFGGGGGQLKLHLNFLLNSPRALGLQLYLDVTNIATNDNIVASEFPVVPLRILDAGVGFYKHFAVRDRMLLTGMAGAHFSFMSPGDVGDESVVTGGVKLEASFSYLMGSQKQHEIRLTPLAISAYAASGGNTAQNFFLDNPGATYAFTIGYVGRFTQAFGSRPIFSLE